MIKNFIYLNEPKLYSFSSQLFEGITDYILNEKHHEHIDEATQKGTIASGKVIADVIKEASTSTTKKFLHDHSFNLFERELTQTDRLLDVSSSLFSFADVCGSGKSFIKVRAKGKFIDMIEVQTLFSNYAKISGALAVLPFIGELQELEKQKAQTPKAASTKSLQAALDQLINQKTAELAANVPARTVSGFETIINNFGDDIVRFQQRIGDVVYSACLSQEFLREPLKNIYRKYSRKTAKEFTVLGFISHSDGTQKADVQDIPESAPMLSHMVGLAENLYDIEQSLVRKEDHEIIIEPIAIYTELQ
ncbi:hypothetical protein ACHELQ_002962 [Vibrio fluvialis]